MNPKVKRWLPISLCCLPGVAIVAVVWLGVAISDASLAGPLRLGLIALTMLACPVSMGLMMRRGSNRDGVSGEARMMADCCAPDSQVSSVESDRLTALRARREALEREVAELEAEGSAFATVAGTRRGN